ncbi:hypothetical protein MANES_11G068178v8 [Manihot esculenta]|uniref:Uncharacterized protein n=1 Tax=Manihot esculenta TaxID=3983 RepID=A0ACB7GZ75_MANES|nr:hypothetical protein MANES_11G068178v8 [Manihot esculenta]
MTAHSCKEASTSHKPPWARTSSIHAYGPAHKCKLPPKSRTSIFSFTWPTKAPKQAQSTQMGHCTFTTPAHDRKFTIPSSGPVHAQSIAHGLHLTLHANQAPPRRVNGPSILDGPHSHAHSRTRIKPPRHLHMAHQSNSSNSSSRTGRSRKAPKHFAWARFKTPTLTHAHCNDPKIGSLPALGSRSA